MTTFRPCAGQTACRDDGTTCLTCGRSLAAIVETRRLLDELTEFVLAEDYDNVEEFTAYVAKKIEKKVRHRRAGGSGED